MRVLFTLDPTNTSELSKIRMRKMVKALQCPGNSIGILNGEDQNLNKKHKDVMYMNDVSEINEADWDIVLVQNNPNLRCIGRRIRRKPVLFISNGGRKKDHFINLPNLYQVIETEKDNYSVAKSIPLELIEFISIPVYKPFKIPQQVSAQNKHYTLVYFVNEKDEDLKVSRSIIKVLNYIPYSSLTVVTSHENITILREIANHNIAFLSDKGATPGKHFSRHDVVLASEDIAMAAVLSRRPVIVVGVNGLGGLVCSDNLLDFMRTGFKGRIGGTYYEDMHAGLLDYEIRYALGIEEEKNTSFIDDAGYSSLNNYYGNSWKKRFLQVINTNISLYQYLTNNKMIVKLVPKVPENIFLQHLKENNEVAIISKLSGKLIGSIGKEEALLIKSCNGITAIETIIEKHSEYSAKDVVDFLVQLWQNKVLILRMP